MGTSGKRAARVSTSPFSSPSSSKIIKLACSILSLPDSDFQEELLGNTSCWHATWKRPKSSARIAAFDIDGTLITHRKDSLRPNKTFPDNENDWTWLNAQVVPKLRQAHANGYTIVFFSNQAGLAKSQYSFRLKPPMMAQRGLENVPFHVFAAIDYSMYRKPATGMWDYFVQYCNEGVEVDLTQSFYVGDSAGRPAREQRPRADATDIDRKFAHNLDLPFYTPEEYFLCRPISSQWSFRTDRWPSLNYSYTGPLFSPSTSPLIVAPAEEPEVVLFIGPPGAGKTKFYRNNFKGEGYLRIGDASLPDALALLTYHFLSTPYPPSCVIDLLLPSRSLRASIVSHIAQLSRERSSMDAADQSSRSRGGIRVRLFHFTTDRELCKHNTVCRALSPSALAYDPLKKKYAKRLAFERGEEREMVPREVWESWDRRWQVPDADEEGIEVIKIHFKLVGTTEEQKKWRRCLDVWKRPDPFIARRTAL
ncbi:BQ5605_C001g00423 [Microbotryum silenes-dioicae]|uniref:BQ5605_C001g00423 protein n=1 Tax=Microbotryum silenes-dioicae TaxID=796604 RepID=A0A2X0M399_9BASI|nr:BQ5605_C001g00423 [Microbotryum silenes-dioicae]